MEQLKFLTQPEHPQEYLENTYYRLKYDVLPDEKYHFSMLTRKAWKIVDINAIIPDSNVNLTRIALLRKNTEPKGEIEILASLIPRDVNPSDWLELWLQKQNANIINGRTFQTDYGTVGDYLSIIQENNDIIVLRTISIKDSNRIFTMGCRTFEKYYNQLAEDFLLAISSFELVNPTRKRFAEKLNLIEIDSPVKCMFRFPAVWEMKLDKYNSQDVYTLNFYNYKEKTAVGVFTFSAVATKIENSTDSLLGNYLSNFIDKGFKVQGEYLVEENENNKNVLQTEIQLTDNKGNEYEMSVILYKLENALILFGLLSFSDTDYYDIHIINKRAFEIAFETFH